jgi:ABC-type branched-subunit amino acid transport system substrate-binding protein
MSRRSHKGEGALRRSIVPVLLAIALLSAGCGSRLSAEERAEAAAGSDTATGTGGAAVGTGAATGDTTGGTGAATGTPTADSTGGGAAVATPGAAPGSGGGTDPGTGAAAECAPQPTDAVGVTDTEVRIGNISTISGPIAGFGETGVNAVKAYVNYVNANGGVCGRQLTLVTADDRLDTGTNRAETARLLGEVFGFVGGTTVVDDGGAQELAATPDVPDVALTIGSQRARLPNNFSPNPINPDQPGNGAIAPLRYFAQQGVASAAIVWPAQADARARGQAYQHDLQQAGITNIKTIEVAITETNYVRVAQEIANAGSQLVLTTLEVSGMARLAQAFEQVGYQPQVPFYGAQAYGGQFLELAGSAADGTKLAVTFSIFEDADQVPAMATFLEWYQRTAPGSNPDFFSIMAWAAADMFTQALRQAGGAPTRAGVVEQLRTQNAYTGEGFMAPRNPPAKVLGDCFVVITVEGGAWRRVEPASGFLNC